MLLLVGPLFAGCVERDGGLATSSLADAAALPDLPLARVLDPWYDAPGRPTTHYHWVSDAPFHTLDHIEARIRGWEERYPDLVRVDVVGYSLEGRPIWDVVVTDETAPGPKITPLIDAGHHANEASGIELALYIVDHLLENHATNATVRELLDTLEIHVVPIVNPDGYVRQTRGNALGVNLNRNYDIDWGNPLGASNLVMGTVAHATGQPMISVPIVLENCGSGPFSEPESRAMAGLFERLRPTAAFYLSHHTPTHALTAPWIAYAPPFPMPPEHEAIFQNVFDWVRGRTEYQAGHGGWGNTDAGLPYAASGSSQDYFYMVARKPAFTFELEFWYTSAQSQGYPLNFVEYEGLRRWLDASLPVPMYLLMNAARLAEWQTPKDVTLVPGEAPAEVRDRPEWVAARPYVD